jgi:hypothetical protein
MNARPKKSPPQRRGGKRIADHKAKGKKPARGKTTTQLLVAMTGKASAAKAAEGDEPEFAYIASLPQPQREIDERQAASWMKQAAAMPFFGGTKQSRSRQAPTKK